MNPPFNTPSNAAAWALRHWDGSLPVPVERVAAALGLRVARVAQGEHSGWFRAARDSGLGAPAIECNPNDSALRQRFALAHGMGHFLLGHGTSPKDFACAFGAAVNDPKERDANRFAMEFLMPAATARHVIMRGYAGDIEELSRLFGVGSLAMGYRLEQIGMLL